MSEEQKYCDEIEQEEPKMTQWEIDTLENSIKHLDDTPQDIFFQDFFYGHLEKLKNNE